MMKVLILEDELRAANRLEKLLTHLKPDMEILAKLESVRDALKFLESSPDLDLIFADVQLADGISFEIFDQIKVSCPIIFTTAYDQYAIEAFKTNGIDYLLKPIELERLAQAIRKVENFSPDSSVQKILSFAHAHQQGTKKYKNRFMVKVGEHIKTLPTDEIKAFYSLEKATFLFTRSQRNYVIDYSMEQLDEILDPERYFRVNRKYIVAVDACSSIYSWSNSRLKIEIEGLEDSEIVVARERVVEFKNWLDS